MNTFCQIFLIVVVWSFVLLRRIKTLLKSCNSRSAICFFPIRGFTCFLNLPRISSILPSLLSVFWWIHSSARTSKVWFWVELRDTDSYIANICRHFYGQAVQDQMNRNTLSDFCLPQVLSFLFVGSWAWNDGKKSGGRIYQHLYHQKRWVCNEFYRTVWDANYDKTFKK